MISFSKHIFHACASLTVVIALTAGSSAFAQQPPVAPPPPGPPVPGGTSAGANPAVYSLQQSENISQAEAEERISLQGDILNLLRSSSLLSDPGFVDLVVRHQPAYQVILSFADNTDKSDLLKEVPPQLRRYIKIRQAKRDKAERSRGFGQLNSALRRTGADFIIGYDAVEEVYFIDVPDQSAKALIEAAIPEAFRSEVRVQVVELPTTEASTTATPSGVKSGDWIAGGYRTTTASGSRAGAPCTLAYSITFGSGLRGILTAGHCTEPKYVRYSDHNVTFNDVYYENITGNYDYAIYRIDGLSTDYRFSYFDQQGIPEFAASGWLNTKNFIRGANQWQGMSVCISGSVSGVTCGKILSTNYDWRQTGSSSFVKVGNGQQTDVSAGGDSGAPWFAYVDARTASDVSATGIHTAGSGSGSSAIAVYMPIDRIFDHVSNVRLMTTPW